MLPPLEIILAIYTFSENFFSYFQICSNAVTRSIHVLKMPVTVFSRTMCCAFPPLFSAGSLQPCFTGLYRFLTGSHFHCYGFPSPAFLRCTLQLLSRLSSRRLVMVFVSQHKHTRLCRFLFEVFTACDNFLTRNILTGALGRLSRWSVWLLILGWSSSPALGVKIT